MYKLALIEIVDKYCIASLKFDKGLDCKPELDFYREQLTDYDMELIKEELAELKEIINYYLTYILSMKNIFTYREHELNQIQAGLHSH